MLGVGLENDSLVLMTEGMIDESMYLYDNEASLMKPALRLSSWMVLLRTSPC